MKRRVEIVVDEHDIAMLESLPDEMVHLRKEKAALLRVLNQITEQLEERRVWDWGIEE